jgi:hypothetical protein
VDPFGRTVVARSTDSGQTWAEPQAVFDSDTDDRDHALNTLPDGTIISTWFSSSAWTAPGCKRPEWEMLFRRVKPDTLAALARGWLRRSHDGGRTWEKSVHPTIVGQHAGPTPFSNGHLIYCGPISEEDGSGWLAATRSTDGGKTWAIVGEICGPMLLNQETRRWRPQLNENHALEIGPDHILCVFRGGSGNWNVHMTETRDGGRTWSIPKDLGIYGFPSYLVKLTSGAILCVYGHRREPYSIRAILSYDNGATWDTTNILTLRDIPAGMDFGYPVALETVPGEVFCVYYMVPGPDTPGYATMDMTQTGILSTRAWLE